MAITPIKKTPPHFQLHSDDQANLSPAKHFQPQSSITLSHSDIPLANMSTSSLGFHPIKQVTAFPSTSHHSDHCEEESSSGSDSESSCDSELLSQVGQLGSERRRKEETVVSYSSTTKQNHKGQGDDDHSLRTATTASQSQFSSLGSEVIGNMSRDHLAATIDVPPSNRKAHKKKGRSSGLDGAISSVKKPKLYAERTKSGVSSPEPLISEREQPSSTPALSLPRGPDPQHPLHKPPLTSREVTPIPSPSPLLVRIPLTGLKVPDPTHQQLLAKPQATVGPYNVRTTVPHRRNTAESLPEQEETGAGRDRYSRLREDYGGMNHDFHVSRGERSRGVTGGRWERDSTRDIRAYPSSSHGEGRGGEYGRGHGWERDSFRVGEDYWSDNGSHYEPSRMDLQRPGGSRGGGGGYLRNQMERKKGPDYYMQEARKRKKDADKIMVRWMVGGWVNG